MDITGKIEEVNQSDSLLLVVFMRIGLPIVNGLNRCYMNLKTGQYCKSQYRK